MTLKHRIEIHVPQGINIMANMPPAGVDQGLFSLNITIIILKCKDFMVKFIKNQCEILLLIFNEEQVCKYSVSFGVKEESFPE